MSLGKMSEIGPGMFALVISLVLIAALLPTAITNWMNANTTGWDPAALAIWNLGPLIIVGGILMMIFGALFAKAKTKGKGL